MNKTLFRSPYAVLALLVSGGFVAWLIAAGHSMGRGGGSDRGYLLWSGWVALALFLAVAAYTLRKFIHRTGLSPELRRSVDAGHIERAEAGINELRRLVSQRAFTTKQEVEKKADAILGESGVRRIMRAHVTSGENTEATFEIALRPTEPLGRVAGWMHLHLYLGIACAVIVLLHGGGDLASPMSLSLNVMSLLVIATGLFGIVVWAIGPSRLTAAENDLSIEEAFVLDRSLEEKLAAALESEDHDQALATLGSPAWAGSYQSGLKRRGPFDAEVHRNLRTLRGEAFAAEREAGKAKEKQAQQEAQATLSACRTLQDLMALVGLRVRVSNTLRRLMRIKRLMNAWRVVHVPLSVLLMGLVFLHVFSVWWY